MIKFELRTILFIMAVCIGAAIALQRLQFSEIVNNPNIGRGIEECEVISIIPGMSLREIADSLEHKKIIDHAADFISAAKFLKLDQRIQAAEYVLPFGKSNAELLTLLSSAGSSAQLTTIPEGYTAKQIAALLQKQLGINPTTFIAAVQDTLLLRKYGLKTRTFEGFLFPDSYKLYRSAKPSWIIQKMVHRFFEVFDSTMMIQCRQSGLTLLETVTLASIIQSEMFNSSEAASISAVYHNRLKKNMFLQADPTLQYIISDGPRRLHNRDLEIDSPYNTYKYPGLPPGPVCNPGKAALTAALNPAKENYLFMVAQGDGSHAFNTDYRAHLHDKVRLDSLRTFYEEQKAPEQKSGKIVNHG